MTPAPSMSSEGVEVDDGGTTPRRDDYRPVPSLSPNTSPLTNTAGPWSSTTALTTTAPGGGGAMTTAPAPSGSGGGGRPPQPHTITESQTSSLRRLVRNLEAQIEDLRSNNRLLQGLLNNQVHENPLPDVAKWEFVKPHMKVISKQLMLGLDPVRSRMFPKEEHMKEEILEVFNVGAADIVTRSAFERAWSEKLKTKVKTIIINRRGRFSTYARTELWRLLGVPKPQKGSQTEIDAWKATLVPFCRDNSWRWRGEDPFGADAFFGAVALIKCGKNYSTTAPMTMLPGQLAWFAYVMDLAMNGDRNMKDTEWRLHKNGIQGYKKFILENRHNIRRIELHHRDEGIGEAALHDILGGDLDPNASDDD